MYIYDFSVNLKTPVELEFGTMKRIGAACRGDCVCRLKEGPICAVSCLGNTTKVVVPMCTLFAGGGIIRSGR